MFQDLGGRADQLSARGRRGGQCGIPPPFPVFAAGGHGLMAGIRGATIPKSSFEAGKNRAIGPGSSLARTIAFELPVGLPNFSRA